MSLQEKLKHFDASLPLASAQTLPNTWYHDQEIYEAELSKLFSNSWQYIARIDQLLESGSYVTGYVGKKAVVVTRDRLGGLNAFYNVCRHKAAKIMTAECGKAPALQCRYHGWTYDLQGKLKGTPEFDGVQGFSKEENGLPTLRVESVGPFVFVNENRDAEPFSLVHAEFAQSLRDSSVEGMRFVKRQEYVLHSNWKVFIDNYLDGGYHVNTLHPALGGALQYSDYQTQVYSHSSLQSAPLLSSGELSQVRKGEAQYWWLMPNLMVNIYDGVMDTNLVIPLDAHRCKVIFEYYFTHTEGSEAQKLIEKSIAVAHQVQLEDQEISESVQEGLEGGTYHTGRFSAKRENALHAFHQLLAKSLRS